MRSATLDQAAAERQQLATAYRRAKKRELMELYADPVHGQRLFKFVQTLNHFGIEDAERMVAYVEQCARGWLRQASEDMRFAALQAISARCMKIRERARMPVFDDPLPGDEDDVYRVCKKALGL